VVIIAQAADTQMARQRGVDAPKSGRVSDVLGMFSDMDSMKTENDSRIEMPSEIFSPWSLLSLVASLPGRDLLSLVRSLLVSSVLH